MMLCISFMFSKVLSTTHAKAQFQWHCSGAKDHAGLWISFPSFLVTSVDQTELFSKHLHRLGSPSDSTWVSSFEAKANRHRSWEPASSLHPLQAFQHQCYGDKHCQGFPLQPMLKIILGCGRKACNLTVPHTTLF